MAEHQGVAIGLGPRHFLHRDVAPATGFVLDDELLAEVLRQPVRHRARDDLGAAPGANGTTRRTTLLG